jgi:YXWGXW repeat-containing protein
MKKLIVGSLVAAALGAVALPAAARTNVDFYVNVAPPPVYYEVAPAPRVGWVWVPGFWDWRHHRHHWVAGHWIRERHGYYYAPARWVVSDGRYYYHRGGWRGRDSDGDGVPDRFDRAPYDPRWR